MKYETLIKVVLSILFLLCLLDMDYGYYQLVRFLGMIGFGILAFYEKEKGNQELFILWLSSAVLIIPLIKISLGRLLWNVIDVIWAVLLIGSIIYKPNYKSN